MIFINIAAYNDIQIHKTITSLWQNTDNFRDLMVSICWQSDNKLNIDLPNVYITWLFLADARGVGYARSLAHNLYSGSDYYLTIDAHTLFQKGWDTQIIKDYKQLQNIYGDKIIISSYAPGWSEYPNGKARKLIPREKFNDFGVLRFRANTVITQDVVFPPISCHFMFSQSQFFIDLPHDPNIFYNGEEITYTVRAFTHGWTNVQPGKAYLYHKYNDKELGHPTIWKDNKDWRKLNKPSIDRVKSICSHNPDNLGCYGKGDIKSLAELEKILKVDFTERKVKP
jgi:hypothetical protein